MSELILHKKARQLCIGEGKAWSLKDFENGVPGVIMRKDAVLPDGLWGAVQTGDSGDERFIPVGA
jgi:hypothetical protein